MKCRHCQVPLEHVFLDLGFAPPSNAYLTAEDLKRPEKYFPLKVMVCDQCWLVQTEDYAQADELFSADYAYFSSTSSSWLAHAEKYSEDIINKLLLDQDSFVIEIAANDGYLLKNFVTRKITCLGIEPTESTASAAEKLGIPVLRDFFGENLAKKIALKWSDADLIIGNNVFAHVPDVNDFTRGLKSLLKQGGTITLEFPHLLNLLRYIQFDTIYHEHFSYLSLYVVNRIFKQAGLRVFDVEELSTHGGSLRVFGCHQDDFRSTSENVNNIIKKEELNGLQSLETYNSFQTKANNSKNAFLMFLLEQNQKGYSVIAYGAAAKGNTLLNYAGVKPDLLPMVCDAAKAKQGKFLPGSHIPIVEPDVMNTIKPDIVLVLPWNIANEVAVQYSYVKEWGGRIVTLETGVIREIE